MTEPHEGPAMSPADFQAWLAKMGFSQRDAAKELGLARNTVARCLKEGADRTVALACAALAAGLEPWKAHSMKKFQTHYTPVVAILEELGGDQIQRAGLRRLAVAAAEKALPAWEAYTGNDDLRPFLNYARLRDADFDEGYERRRTARVEAMPEGFEGPLESWKQVAAHHAREAVLWAVADHHERAVRALFDVELALAGDDEIARKEAIRKTEAWVLKEWAVSQKTESHRQKQA